MSAEEAVLATSDPDHELWTTNLVVYIPQEAVEAVLDINWRISAMLVRQDKLEKDKLAIISSSIPQMEAAIRAIRDIVRRFDWSWKGDGDVGKAVERMDRADAERAARERSDSYSQRHQRQWSR